MINYAANYSEIIAKGENFIFSIESLAKKKTNTHWFYWHGAGFMCKRSEL